MAGSGTPLGAGLSYQWWDLIPQGHRHGHLLAGRHRPQRHAHPARPCQHRHIRHTPAREGQARLPQRFRQEDGRQVQGRRTAPGSPAED
ncbi:MAG: hypothetical protein MZV70_66065 [Desulfobacterales bacterium]|nr:hypothetical protein [Desulfobacterales bacterium]